MSKEQDLLTDNEIHIEGKKKPRKIKAGWFRRFLKRAKTVLKRLWESFKRQGKKLLSPAFFIMLFLSASMWFSIKLSYDYKTEMPVTVNVEGYEFKVNCMVDGRGAQLFARRYYKNRAIQLRWSDLDVSPSSVNPGWEVISPYSLQNAISVRITDIKILSLGPIPEIKR